MKADDAITNITDAHGERLSLGLDWTTDGERILLDASGPAYTVNIEMSVEEAERFAKKLRAVLRHCAKLRRH
jgi:hypothetical protein